MIEIAVQCNKCGLWSGLITTSLKHAIKVCPGCGNHYKIKGKFIYNVNVKFPGFNQNLNELVANLKLRETGK